MISSIAAVSLAAIAGTMLRWFLGVQLNSLFPSLPMGTLTVNLVGGYLIGIAVAFFALHPALPIQYRLMTITGFLGGLTTFSAFSAEVVAQLMVGRFGWAAATILAHVVGSVSMTLLGIGTVHLFRASHS